MILNDIDNLIEEINVEKEVEHYSKLRHVPKKVIDNPKLAVKITKNVTKDLIKNSPSLATGIITGVNPKGTVELIKYIKRKKHRILKHPLDTTYNISGAMGGWDEVAKIVVDNAIKSTKNRIK